MQIVAFPRSGVLRRSGTRELLDAALAPAPDVLGALDPATIDGDPAASLDLTFALATKHQSRSTSTCTSPVRSVLCTLGLLLDRVEARGPGRPRRREPCVLPRRAARARARRAARADRPRGRRAADHGAGLDKRAAGFHAARAAGVALFGGNDGVRDTWTPFGSPDMLERAMLIAMRYDLRRDDDLAAAFAVREHGGGARCGFADYGLVPGARADLVLVDAEAVAHAVASRPPARLAMANGTIIAADFTR